LKTQINTKTFTSQSIHIKNPLCLMILAVLFLYPVGASIFQSFWNGSNLNIKGYAGLFTDCFIFYRLFWNSVFYASIIIFSHPV